jgi:hypothetical protein
MSRKALKVLWWLFALFSLTLGVVADLSAAGATSDPGLLFGVLKRTSSEVPVLALPVQIIVVGVVLWLTRIWSTAVGGDCWAAKVPIPYFDEKDIDPTQPGGKVFQGAVIVLFVIVPFVLLVLVAVKYLDASVYYNVKRGPTELITFDSWGHFGTRTIYVAAAGRPGFFRAGTEHGPQYYPLLTWVYACAILLEVAYLARVLGGIFRSKRIV